MPCVALGSLGVATLPWNQWQLCRGISGSFAMESVAALLWNQWQLWCGIDGNFAVESVATFARNTQSVMADRAWAPQPRLLCGGLGARPHACRDGDICRHLDSPLRHSALEQDTVLPMLSACHP